MSDMDNRQSGNDRPQRVFSNYYSRERGVATYRKRRRVNFITRVAVGVVLVLIVGGAAILFGRQFVYMLTSSAGSATNAETKAESHATAQITTVQPAEVSFAIAGDIVANSGVVDSGRRADGNAYNFVHLFSNIKDAVTTHDLCMVFQETGMYGDEYGFGGTSQLNAPQDLGRAEVAAGFNVALHATDHALDMGPDGLHNELAWWHNEQPDVAVLGVAEPDPVENPGFSNYVDDVYVYERGDFKVAVLNHTQGINESDEAIVSPLTEAKVREDVDKAKELGAQMIVACPHWGEENSSQVSDEQREFAKLYASLGVDVVVGSGPRVLQEVEVLDGEQGHKTLCYYSLGCLVSSLNANNLLGGIAEFKLERSDQGEFTVADAVLKPVVTHRASGEDFAAYLLSEYTPELAQKSWDNLTPDYLGEQCEEVLGTGYDADAGEYKISI